ncbi:MAG: tRNA (guanosine(46)-N7)-methyltransferase TrmB [Verrucomicrobiales bacterium]
MFVRTAETHELVPADYFAHLDVQSHFERPAPLEIDLGCGDGTFLIDLAREHPERNFLGIERLLGRVRKVSRKAERAGLHNVRVLRLESLYTVQWLLPPASVTRLHLLCPDPWPKARHHKRRLVQNPFLEAVHRALVPQGEFLFKTDHDEYFDWACEFLDASPLFTREAWEDDSFFYPKTDFQRQWEAQGKRLQAYRARAL